MSQLFTSGSHSIRASVSASVLPMNIQGGFPLGLTGLISCCPKDFQESSPAPQFKSINSSILMVQPRQGTKKQRHHFADKGLIVRAMVFSVVMYRCESWTVTNGNSAVIRRGCRAGSLSF